MRDIGNALRQLLADVFALYVKTKSFHWHTTGPQFRDYHLLLDEQAGQLLAMTDSIAERARKLGQPTLHSITDITNHQRLRDQDGDALSAIEMLSELRDDNRRLTAFLRTAHQLCDERGDMATTGLIELWIDESEGRAWFLGEITGDPPGRELDPRS